MCVTPGVHPKTRQASAKLRGELSERSILHCLLDQANTIRAQLEDIKNKYLFVSLPYDHMEQRSWLKIRVTAHIVCPPS